MRENVNRELNLLARILGAAIAAGGLMYLVMALVPIPTATIAALPQSPLQLPPVQYIQTVSVSGDGGCSGSVPYTPLHPLAAAEQTLQWLREAKPLSVKLPKLRKVWSSTCGAIPYYSLILRTNGGDDFVISPAHYVWRGKGVSGWDAVKTYYVRNVVEVDVNQAQRYFYESAGLYDWLQEGG